MHNARRPRSELLSIALDGARECGAKDGARGDVLMMLVDPAAHERLAGREHLKPSDEVDTDGARDAFGPLETPRDALVQRSTPGAAAS